MHCKALEILSSVWLKTFPRYLLHSQLHVCGTDHNVEDGLELLGNLGLHTWVLVGGSLLVLLLLRHLQVVFLLAGAAQHLGKDRGGGKGGREGGREADLLDHLEAGQLDYDEDEREKAGAEDDGHDDGAVLGDRHRG